MNKILLSVLVCFVLTIPTKAHPFTNSEWLELCEKNESLGVCIGYLKGLLDMERVFDQKRNLAMEGFDKHLFAKNDKSLNLNERLDANTSGFLREYIQQVLNINKFCIPPKVNLSQIEKIMKKKLNEKPEELHRNLRTSFLFILSEVFPCKKQ
tara:strand:+ start:113 stop:571 length:459 start_codon:yes stop_codon:yes gene_type:complete